MPKMPNYFYSCTVISLILLLPNFIHYNINETKVPVAVSSKLDSSLLPLRSLNAICNYTDSVAHSRKIEIGSEDYAILASKVVSHRFYHKYATQDLNENWIAAVAQKISGLYLSSKITADDILTKNYGYCGQQNTVLMEMLQRKNIVCRVVYPYKHFTIQAFINQRWVYFDADLDPDMTPAQRENNQLLYNRDSLMLFYHTTAKEIDQGFGNPISIKYGKPDEKQGPDAQIFQAITKILSHVAFIIPILWAVYLSRNQKKKIAATISQQTTEQRHHYLHSDERVGNRA